MYEICCTVTSKLQGAGGIIRLCHVCLVVNLALNFFVLYFKFKFTIMNPLKSQF